ncbi:hypothetical protein ABL840_18415 [Variovorax sp. NFACC27]|uniref:Uncharacterized protein n=1 Tax=Variovorax gossypii TaxID=1679495 RepID=A0A3S0QCC7_9BURK|nr:MULTISPECIES: hypothetical protein [Variovorax]MDP9600978.1 hypothetical protein [Variovorax paradoxus]SEF33512.1 hypothetical protein SAMN03159371_06527 [Variovorax sp. NFACC28]SEG97278.1 hypothetical protein SAMN03159365_06814 [Variovorax sp. NFACC29]SFD89629.1 hypothetical protein SAMN03159379_06667 [Variovorax sp. NFACC26]SFH17347.1 hypothetical protein SAMN03159447_07058 [Variovorax sp. NFACC27]
MEVVHWVFLILGSALALTTQWFLIAPFSLDWRPLRAQIVVQVTQAAALLEECAATADSTA